MFFLNMFINKDVGSKCMDIIFPKGNELEFFKMAERLGWNELCLVYDKKIDISQFRNKTKLKLRTGLLCKPSEARKLNGKADFIFVKGAEGIRQILEQGSSDIIFDLETLPENDHMHYKKSGLNQVLCKLAVDNNTVIGISFSSILKLKGRKRASFIGRTMQNIMFARKFGIKLKIASFASTPFEMRSQKDLIVVGRALGMSTEQVENSKL